jgi:general secretion pathway protein C
MQPLSLPLKLFTFLIWLALAGSATYWVLKMTSSPEAPPHTIVSKNPSNPSLDLNRMAQILGAVPEGTVKLAPAVYANRLVLQGAVATSSGGGVALISVDNAPPKPFRVGAEVIEGVRLQGVSKNSALVGSERIFLVGTQAPTSNANSGLSLSPPPPVVSPVSPTNPTIAPSGFSSTAKPPSSVAPPSSAGKGSLGTSVDPSQLPPEIAKAIQQAHSEPNPLPPISPGAGANAGGQAKFEYPNLVKP